MSLTPYVVAMIKCGYDGPPEGDYAPVSCFTPPKPGYVLAMNLDKGVYLEMHDCDVCMFEVSAGLYVVNVWDGERWRVDYVEASDGYIVTGAKADGSTFTTTAEITAAAPAIDIWRVVVFMMVAFLIANMIGGGGV